MTKQERARQVWKWTALVTLSALVVLSSPLAFGYTYFGRDLHLVEMGMICAVRAGVAAGDLGVSSLLGNGAPLLAEPHAQLFYPLRWLTLLAGPEVGASLQIVVHLSVATGAMFFLLRSFYVRPRVALSFAIVFLFAGTTLDLVAHGIFVVSAASLPVVWAAARRARARAPWSLTVLTVGLALPILAGEPQAFAIAAGLALLHGVDFRRRRLRIDILVAIGLAPMVGAVAIAPALAEAARSARLGDGAFLWLMWPFGHDQLVASVVPIALRQASWQSTTYLSAPIFVLAAFGARRAPRAAIFGGIALVLSTGVVLLPLLAKVLPLVANFRYPAKYFFPATCAAVVLSALALKSQWLRTGIGRTIAVSLMLGLFFSTTLTSDIALPLFERAHALGFIAIIAVSLFFNRALRLLPFVFAVHFVAAGVVFLQVGERLGELDVPTPKGVSCHGANREAEGHFLVEGDAAWSEYAAARYEGRGALHVCLGHRRPHDYLPLKPAAMSAIDAGYSVPGRYTRAMGCQTRIEMTSKGLRYFKVPDAMGEAIVLPAPILLPDRERIERLKSDDDHLSLVSAVDEVGRIASSETARISSMTRARPSAFTIELEGSGPATVVVNQRFASGWALEQAGKRLPRLEVAAGRLGVFVEQVERGPVQAVYRPPRLVLALVISSVGVGISATLSFIRRRRRRMTRRPGSPQ